MWISKEQYVNMKSEITELKNHIESLREIIDEHKQCINQLMQIHDLHKTDYYNSTMGEYHRFNRNIHPEQTINLGDIDNLTFKELAEYVINGKPITRVREHEVVVCPKTKVDKEVED